MWGSCAALLVGTGAVLVLTTGITSVYWPEIYFQQLTKRLVLTNESLSFGIWRETPIPMYLEVFMWNMSNAAEVLAGGRTVKPHFNQLGPYVFREQHVKTNLTWHPDNSTVTFFNNRTWYFEPDMSNGTLDDNITNVNVVVASTAFAMRLQPFVVRPVVNAFMLLMHEHMLMTASVRDWVFDGISDPIITWAIENNIDVGIPYDRFGWFYTRNGSETFDGAFNMETGAADLSRLGNIAQWNYSPRTPFHDTCGDVRGSTGELWPPEQEQDELSIFASDLCTYMTLHRDADVERLGVSGVRYVANDSVFDNGHHYPSMACYCDDPASDECVPHGALNVSMCRFGAPAFVSFPHFYNADPSYLDKVEGLSPSREEHEFYLSLELFTGIPLEVRAQLQINILLRHVTGMTIANALPDDTLVPMFWFRQEVQLTDEFASQARLALALRTGVLYTLYALVGVGACLLVGGTGMLLRSNVASRTTPLLDAETPASAAETPAPAADTHAI